MAASLQGCQIHVSEAYFEASENKEWHSESKSGYSFLHGIDISIYVRTSNEDPIPSFGHKQYPNYFGISLWFNPKVDSFMFNPDQVFLSLPKSERLKPAKTKLVLTGMRVDAAGWECGRSRKTEVGSGPFYPLQRGLCVELYFEGSAPSPETSFSMHLEGLTRDNKKVVVPEIRFRKGSFWQMG